MKVLIKSFEAMKEEFFFTEGYFSNNCMATDHLYKFLPSDRIIDVNYCVSNDSLYTSHETFYRWKASEDFNFNISSDMIEKFFKEEPIKFKGGAKIVSFTYKKLGSNDVFGETIEVHGSIMNSNLLKYIEDTLKKLKPNMINLEILSIARKES